MIILFLVHTGGLLADGRCSGALLCGTSGVNTRLSMRTDSYVNYWIMLTNTPKVFVISPLSGLLRDQLLTFGVFLGTNPMIDL